MPVCAQLRPAFPGVCGRGRGGMCLEEGEKKVERGGGQAKAVQHLKQPQSFVFAIKSQP